MKKPLCRHCRKSSVNRPRGLCWNCYYTPGVKDLYPSTSKYARKGIGGDNHRSILPRELTIAEPGSPEKVAVMCERAARGESLFHPDEPRLEPSGSVMIAVIAPRRSGRHWNHQRRDIVRSAA